MERTAVYPGTFDPITNGHLDIIERAAQIFDWVIVALAVNSAKKTLFTEQERFALATQSLGQFANVRVMLCSGLIVEFARQQGAVAIVRGLRAVSDFEYELQMALMNKKMIPEINTMFLMPHERYTYLNSSIIRELARYGSPTIRDFVPAIVADALMKKEEFRARNAG
ncbi:MAG: pantetheine-phosphate adenylyltransferase [Chlorobi bacterium]|nr:pantetheine-phosphate adenylyltransferase [Chlorobiota bacterium]